MRLAKYLESHEEEFAELLAQKTNADMIEEQKHLEAELNKATARNGVITTLFSKTYEDKVSEKLSDEMFMEMEILTAPMLQELIDHIDVYEKEGGNKNYTQRIMIYYRFVGFLELPETPNTENYKADTRKGVAVEYIPTAKYA